MGRKDIIRVAMLLIAAWGLTGGTAWGQEYAVSGKVTDAETGEILLGVNVILANTMTGTSTNADGEYKLELDSAGLYTIEFSSVGYFMQKITLRVTGEEELDIQLEPDLVCLDCGMYGYSVVVYGSRYYPATSSTTLLKKDLAPRNLGQDLPTLLAYEPSVVTSTDAGAGVGYSQMRIRGTDPARTNVTVNGIPLNDAESQGVFWVNMPDFASSVDNLSIQRGVGDSRNGAGAFGATVSLNTTVPQDEASASTAHSYGSFNTRKHNAEFHTGTIGEHFSFYGRASRITSDGFIDDASSELTSWYASGQYEGEIGTLRANVFSGSETTFHAWYGVLEDSVEAGNRTHNLVSGYDEETDNYTQTHYQLLYEKNFGSLDLSAALHYTKGAGYFEQYIYDNFEDPLFRSASFSTYGMEDVTVGGETLTETDLVRRLWLDNDFYGAVFNATYSSGGGLRLDFGGGFNVYEGHNFGRVVWAQNMSAADQERFLPHGHIEFYRGSSTKADGNVYAKAKFNVAGNLYAFGDVQVRRVDYEIRGEDFLGEAVNADIGQTHAFTFVNPKVGLEYSAGRFDFYGFYGLAHKEPNRIDFVQSSEDDRPKRERLQDVELGAGYADGTLSFSANAYYMRYQDQLVQTGQLNDVGFANRVNVPDSYRAGIELVGSFKLWRFLQWDVNATFSRNKIDRFVEYVGAVDENFAPAPEFDLLEEHTDTDIAFSPSVVAGTRLSYDHNGLTLGLMGKYVGEQYLDNTQSAERRLDAFLVSDLQASYAFRLGEGGPELALNLLVNNLFDAEYAPNGYTFSDVSVAGGQATRNDYNYLYPQAGTNFLVGARVRF